MIAALALVLGILAITPAAIKAHIDFLASDALEGRETGTRGYDVAAAYVAAQFEAAGLAPAGDDGTYFQQVRLRTMQVDPAQSSFSIAGVPFTHRKDVIVGAMNAPVSDVDAEVVFAGFGVTSPEMKRDDYANIDVRGKIAAILTGAPPQFPHSERAYYSSGLVKTGTAVAHGAIGIVIVRTLEMERRFSWARTLATGDSKAMHALDRNGQLLEDFPQIRGVATLGPAAAQELFGSSLDQLLNDADKGVTRSFPLNKRVAIHAATTLGEATSANVVAMVRGSHLPNEHVVVSAHLDHLGLLREGEDRIRNGALDNASGIAALLEIAKAAAAMPRPSRSIVFLAATAEEKGTQGSLAFADHPPLGGPIVANVNMDMLTMLFPMRNLVALGIEHSSLAPLAAEAARRNGFDIQDDPLPEEVRFVRSDQFSFVKKGIPAISYKGGFHDEATAKLTRDWLRAIYHSVDDESTQQLDYDSGARWAQTNLDLAVAIANAKNRPRWNAGDFFSVSRPRCCSAPK
jgi:peptidase M28-like protein